jgi:hypothetical protein
VTQRPRGRRAAGSFQRPIRNDTASLSARSVSPDRVEHRSQRVSSICSRQVGLSVFGSHAQQRRRGGRRGQLPPGPTRDPVRSPPRALAVFRLPGTGDRCVAERLTQ